MRPASIFKLMASGALALGLATAAATPRAEPSHPSPRQCFWARDVNGFAYGPPDTVNLRVGVREVYQLTLFGACNDIDFANAIRFDTHGFSSVCNGLDIDLIVPSPTGPQRCPVRALRRLTPQEIAALPRRARP